MYQKTDSVCVIFVDSVLVNEGEQCDVIGFIKKGECLRRRRINVARTFPNGKKVSVKLHVMFPFAVSIKSNLY